MKRRGGRAGQEQEQEQHKNLTPLISCVCNMENILRDTVVVRVDVPAQGWRRRVIRLAGGGASY